jgi:hypothetical protein
VYTHAGPCLQAPHSAGSASHEGLYTPAHRGPSTGALSYRPTWPQRASTEALPEKALPEKALPEKPSRKRPLSGAFLRTRQDSNLRTASIPRIPGRPTPDYCLPVYKTVGHQVGHEKRQGGIPNRDTPLALHP